MAAEIPDAAFLRLETPSYAFAETTPEVPEEFRGFRLAGPQRLVAGGMLRIPVSAVARFGGESAQLPNPLWDSIAAVVVEVESNRCWVGSLMDPHEMPEDPPAEEDSEPVEGEAGSAPDDDLPEIDVGGVATQCAHVDLRELLELPTAPGSYEIHLTYGPWASNAVRVVVERPREGE